LTVKFWAHKDRFGDAYIRRNFDWFVRHTPLPFYYCLSI
jgi:hypothetical protein